MNIVNILWYINFLSQLLLLFFDFQSKHPVEEAVSKILQTSENTLDNTKTLTVAEEKALQAMSLEEVNFLSISQKLSCN